jgi:hypothetical protein
VQCLLDSALDPVLDEAEKKEDPEKAILALKVCDFASGSGHFLTAAAHRMAKRLAAIRTEEQEPAPDAIRTALRDVIGHCIYGVDINPMAVELCKVALWMEALEAGKPLSFLDHHIQCGNSLIGATPALLKKGIPDEAFTPIEGDDKQVCKEYKRANKQEREKRQISMFDHEGMPWENLGNLATAMMQIDGLPDDTVEGVKSKQKRYEEFVASTSSLFGKFLADTWCASFVWKKTKEFPYPITEEVFRNIERNPYSAPQWLKEEVERLAKEYQFFHWHLVFPDVFYVEKEPENEQTGWSGGFDVIIGNPPWERVKLQEKEWFAVYRPDIAKAPSATIRKRLIQTLKEEDEKLLDEFFLARRKSECELLFLRESGLFPLCGRGDINTYAVFAELSTRLINRTGSIGIIIPSGIATDDTTKFFFQSINERNTLVSLFDFENKKAFFPDVHSNMKFCLMTLNGIERTKTGGALFVSFAHSVADIHDENKIFELTKDEIALLNPDTKTYAIFRSRLDAEITKNIYRRVPILINEKLNTNNWGIWYNRMFDMSNDSGLFRTKTQLIDAGWKMEGNRFVLDGKKYLPLVEAKTLYLYDHRAADVVLSEAAVVRQGQSQELSTIEHSNPFRYSTPRFWIHEECVAEFIEENANSDWFLGWRDITSTTNERTVISSIIPYSAVGNKYILIHSKNISKFHCLYANLCSFILDYVARQKLGGITINYFVMSQLPILEPSRYDHNCLWECRELTLSAWIMVRVLELSYSAWDLEPFAKDCGYEGAPFKWDEDRRFLLRCELDAAYFHLYEMGRGDVDYIMETFPIVKRRDEAKYGDYRTKRVILEIYDKMRIAMETGVAYKTRLDPPPADVRVAHHSKDSENDAE